MGEASSPKGIAYLQLLQEPRGRHGASAIDAFVRVACLAQVLFPDRRGVFAQEMKGEEDMRLEYALREESKKERKEKQKGCRTKLRLAGDPSSGC